MANDETPISLELSAQTTRSELIELIGGDLLSDPDTVFVIDTDNLPTILLNDEIDFSRPFTLGNDLILLQPGGTLLVLQGAVQNSFLIDSNGYVVPVIKLLDFASPNNEWAVLGDVDRLDDPLFGPNITHHPGSGLEIDVLAGNPLIGLPYNPLLPPTDYTGLPIEEFETGRTKGAPLADIEIVQLAPVWKLETDADVSLSISSFFNIYAVGAGIGEEITRIDVQLNGLPAGMTASAGTLIDNGDGSFSLDFSGTPDKFESLVLTFPADFSSTSRNDFTEGDLQGTITVQSNFYGDEVKTFDVRVIPEGDAIIDDTLPDTVSDETDGQITMVPSELLGPLATDVDGSETIDTLVLEIDGLPAGSTIASLGIILPDGAVATIEGGSQGSAKLVATFEAASVGDVVAAYNSIILTLPTDFSTANRNDLTTDASFPITVKVSINTDEDSSSLIDSATDGTVVAERMVTIGYEADIELALPEIVVGKEDNGAPNASVGVDVALSIDVTVSDADGSETEDPTDARFAVRVDMVLDGLPTGTTVNGGTLSGENWTGTVAQAEALVLSLPGDYSGTVLNTVSVVSPEGQVESSQVITITPSPDVSFDGEIEVDETDAPVEVLLSDFLSVVISDSDETVRELTFTLPGLPAGTVAEDAAGNPVGTMTPEAGGTFIFTLFTDNSTGSPDPSEVRIIFPADFSTENPSLPLEAEMTVITEEGGVPNIPVTGTIPIRVNFEGDVVIDDTTLELDETDDVVTFKLSENNVPMLTDIDSSESITQVTVTFALLPQGARYSTDDGATFSVATSSLDFSGTLEEYNKLVIELPKDFSTENPATTLTATISALSDEGGADTGTVDVIVNYELDVALSAPASVIGEEDSLSGDASGVTVDLGIDVQATDDDFSEDTTTVEIAFTDLPTGVGFSGGSFVVATSIWSGTMAEANALTLTFPADYSGTTTAIMTALSPEGSTQVGQTIEITPTGDIDFTIIDLAAAETDSPVTITPSDAWSVYTTDFDTNLPRETLNSVTLTLSDLPPAVTFAGAPAGTVTYDVSAGGAFVFTGTEAQYLALTLTFPTDYSTQSPAAGGDTITGTLQATSTEDTAGQSQPVTLSITPEGDVEIDASLPDTIPDETDTATLILPSSLLAPSATDLDGSESIAQLTLVIDGLPAGSTLVSLGITLPAGATAAFTAGTLGSELLTVTMLSAGVGDVLAAYDAFEFTLPKDFSTTNRVDLTSGNTQQSLNFTLSVTTDEDQDLTADLSSDGQATASRVVEIDYELDVDLAAPGTINGDEDGDGVGVTLDLEISVAVTDIDGSEDSTVVEIKYADIPTGVVFSGGTYTAATSTWNGTVAEANALEMTLLQDYSGTITSTISANSPEGTVDTSQTIVVAAKGDISISNGELTTAETDARVEVTPGTTWQVTITDTDPTSPPETITSVTLTLNALPADVQAFGVPASTVTYDAVAGGDLTFTGTIDQYNALRLSFPADYSTESPAAGGSTILGTVAATSTEDSTGISENVVLRITPEGDAIIDTTMPDTVPDETDAPTLVTPADLLAPQVTDVDGSEAISTLRLTIEGLPDNVTIASLNMGLPVGITPVLTTAADGSQTLVILMESAAVADIAAVYAALTLTLPTDFSTENRSDLVGGAVTLPLNFTLEIQTDEDQNSGDDTPVDGTVVATRSVDIGFEEDITLSAPVALEAQEDGGFTGDPDPGVSVDLGIEIAITDDDGSETADPTNPQFAAVVTIQMGDLPAAATANLGTLVGGNWTGTVAEAEALVLYFPPNFNGSILNVITVTTPEGERSTLQAVNVTPTPDIIIDGLVEVDETDAEVEVKLSDFITVTVGPGEVLKQLGFTLDDLPTGTYATDEFDNPAGSFTVSGPGTVQFTYAYDASIIPTPPSPNGIKIFLPKDWSTTNPDQDLSADLVVTTGDGTVTGSIPFIVKQEGDIEISDGSIDVAETDTVVLIKPSIAINPIAIDDDSSESVTQVGVVFVGLPDGTRFSIDDGVTYNTATSTLDFLGTLAEYNMLVIELPQDYSTENPATDLVATIMAITDEGGSATATLTVTLTAEGDVVTTGSGLIQVTENDAPPPATEDEDATTTLPQLVRPSDAVQGNATDIDASESITQIDVSIAGLPTGTYYSIDDGASFIEVTTAPDLVLNGLTAEQYDDLLLRLPDDYSSVTPITGSVTFTTDEAILAGETDVDATDGIETANFTIEVASEADVQVTATDITVIEDLGTVIPLGASTIVTDIDGSETITAITVTFSGLSAAGDTLLTDGTIVTSASPEWTGTSAELAAIGVTSFPEHFSGVIDITVNVITDEGTTAGTSETFQLNVTPVAEPEITLSVDSSPTTVTERGADNFLVKEDSSFLLVIDASTPDLDGSETLTQIVIENMPAGWVADSGGNVDLALFESGSADIASATLSGTTLTIVLVSGVDTFNGTLRVQPLTNDDRDVETIVGQDLKATVTSQDTAAGLPTDTATATYSTDVDVDAVVDGAVIDAANSTVNENKNNARTIPIDLQNIALTDTDGSEVFTTIGATQALELTISVETMSDSFDPSDSAQLSLYVSDNSLAGYVTITQSGFTSDSVNYSITPSPTATSAQIAGALESLAIKVPQHFSGILTEDGVLNWNETTTGDVEDDVSDNSNSSAFSIVETVEARAEAVLTAGVFVRGSAEVTDSSPSSVTATITNGTIAGDEILTLLESTSDTSGPGQVELFVQILASTPDVDGSEQINTIVISNVPSEWIAAHLNGTSVEQSAFFTQDGASPLPTNEYAKIQSAEYSAATGELTLTLIADVVSFSTAIQLQPTLYEDYDVDREDSDQFTSAGTFYGEDLTIEINAVDDNSQSIHSKKSEASFDVDVDPVNNFATIILPPVGNEQVIDDAGGIWQIPFTPVILDTDGSETVTAVVLRNVPSGITVFITDPDNPTGDKIPALLFEVNTPPGFNSWSLSEGEWDGAELRGIPTHYAGDYSVNMIVVTTESDGGGTRTTNLVQNFRIDPVVDGGNPSENLNAIEDTAVQVQIDGNIIDNSTNSPGSPEDILGLIVLTNIVPDSEGRVPRFFDGQPIVSPTNSAQYTNELTVTNIGNLEITPTQAANLWVLPGTDSNEDIQFNVTLTYYETLKPIQVTEATGTITIQVRGIADDPILTLQDADPTNDSSFIIGDARIDDYFRPDEIVDTVSNADRVYGYVGKANTPFLLNKHLSQAELLTGVTDENLHADADLIFGDTTEITFGDGDPDGSETLYFLIRDVDPNVAFLGATPIDTTGETYIVTAAQLADIRVVAGTVSEVTYYDMRIHAIVVEDDQPLNGLIGTTDEELAQIDALPGGSVVTENFSIVVLPNSGNGGDCDDDQHLTTPILELIGSGDEDTDIPFKLKLTPDAFYQSIGDLTNLPNGVLGDFAIGIKLPDGATLTSDVNGAILFDPVTGLWVIDLEKLGVDSTDPTQTAGSIILTPPEHQSSPANTFDPTETFGNEDPYDSLNTLEYNTILNNITCGTITSSSDAFAIQINPVVDGPSIVVMSDTSFDEDTPIALDIEISGIDGGERPSGDVFIDVDSSNGGSLFDSAGDPITGTDIGGNITRYTLGFDELSGLTLEATEHYSGPLQVSITASSEDIDGSIKANTTVLDITIIPVADEPYFDFDDTVIDPETGLPYVDNSGSVPIVTIIEDRAFNLADVVDANSPDQDGSETVSIILSGVPDYLLVTGPSGGGFVDNGDGSYSISLDAFPNVQLILKDENARTPDSLDATIPNSIPLTLTVNTLELANSDEEDGSINFSLVVLPDADLPTLQATISPTTGVEDQAGLYTLNLLSANTDPHEALEFQIEVPTNGVIYLDGVPQTAVGGIVTLAGIDPVSVRNLSFTPEGVVTFSAPPDFAGNVSLNVTAVSTDTNGSYTDTATSAPVALDLTIDVAPDLILTVSDATIELTETDAPLSYSPATDFDIDVTDIDGSEVIDSVIYTLTGTPAGTQISINGTTPTDVTGDTIFSGSYDDFQNLAILFPTDFATNGVALDGTLQVTTNEGGDETGSFTVNITGELDLTPSITVDPIETPATGATTEIEFGIIATVTDVQTTQSETLEEVVVQFDDPLPVGTVASAGILSGDRQTLTLSRGASTPAEFAVLVAALAITIPTGTDGVVAGTLVVSTNHGSSAADAFSVAINSAPVVTGPIDYSTTLPTFVIQFSELLANSSDAQHGLTVENVSSADGDLAISVAGTTVSITVPAAYVGTPTLTYNVVDDGPGNASTPAEANLDIDTLQMLADGSVNDPLGASKTLMSNVLGSDDLGENAKATGNDDAVVIDATHTYDKIEGFEMQGGADFVDLSASANGFSVDLGDGADWAIGSSSADILDGGAGADILQGGLGADTLTGGADDDTFVLTDLTAADVISDYEAPTGIIIFDISDEIDMTALVQLDGLEVIDDLVAYDNSNGELSVEGTIVATVNDMGGGFSDQVAVIFENASGGAETAVI